MLATLADVLGVGIAALFGSRPSDDPASGGVVTRQLQRAELKLWRTGISKQLLSPAGTENRLNLFLVHLEPGGNTGDELYTHDGEEAGLVLEGEMTLTVDAETWSLKTGDSFRFASRSPHRFSNPGGRCESGRAVGELRDAGVMNDVWNKKWIRPGEDWSPHSAHWGAFSARWNGATLDIRPYEEDPAPSSILQNFTTAMRHKARILRPMVRKAWLDRSKPATRGFDQKFVACPWDEVLDLLANELSRVRTEHGAAAVFGGSYGWSSAGRFHHAQSQVHRFLNTAFGGYVRSVNSYSAGASAVILPHVLGGYEGVSRHNVTWDQVAEHTDTVLAFGGMALKNSDVASGGISRHIERDAMAKAARRGASILRHQPIARRHAGSGRRPLAADQGRHRRGADAGARAHAPRRKSLGPRLCRALLHRLRHLRTLSARPR